MRLLEAFTTAGSIRRIRVPLLAAIAAALFYIGPGWFDGARAQPSADMVLRIAAVVNDDIISVYDIEARTDLLVASSGMPNTPEMRGRIRDQVLRALIDETLKLQEAERLELDVTEDELARAVRQVEQQNRIPPGGFEDFIRATGVDRETTMRQIRAEIAWIKSIRVLFDDEVNITEEQVDIVMNRLQAARGKPEHLVNEIYLPVDNPADEGRVRENAQRLLAELRDGASFAPLARQFSQSPSAAKGGQLGWVRQGELETTLEQTLLGMREGSISEPIRTVGGFHILQMLDRRLTAEPDPDNARLSISQLALPSSGPKALSSATREEIKTVVRQNVETCDDLNALAEEMDVPNSGAVGSVPVSGLQGPMRDVLLGLGENEASEPLRTPNGELILMVCKREVPGGMPTREEIRERLRQERLEAIASGHLRTLRQQALIDIRI
jgi:peptidyl-prolyl cis-trans isomerase SurA